MRAISLSPVLFASLISCDGAAPVFTDAAVRAEVFTDAPPGPSGVGAQCSDERELTEVQFGCRAQQLCFTSGRGFPFGYCTRSCRGVPCPDDALCVAQGGQQFCLQRCARDSECRAAQGYVCARPGAGLAPACVPDPSPLGLREGAACAPTRVEADAGVFDEALSADREDSDLELDPTLAVSPTTGHLVAVFAGRALQRDLSGLLARSEGMGWTQLNPLRDRDFEDVTGPTIAFDATDGLYAAWKAESFDRPSVRLRVGGSRDEGASFSAGSLDEEAQCAAGCLPPSLAAWGAGQLAAAFVAYAGDGSARLFVRRSSDGGARWGASSVLARDERVRGGTLAPSLSTLHWGDEALHALWIMERRDNTRARLGDVLNELRYSRGGAVERVSAEGEGVVSHAPSMIADGALTHAAYVAGEGDGRWDVILATRDAEGRWSRRRVHDDPPCATHGWPSLARRGDGALQVLWLDNREGEGHAWTARCSSDPQRGCERPVRVSSRGFRMNTSDEPTRGHGVRTSLATGRDGTLHAAWSDTRRGGPAIWSARLR